MTFPEEWGAGGGDGGPTESKLVPLSMQSNEALLIKTLLARSCPSARLSRVQRVQNKMLWRAYANYRDDQLVHTCAGGDVNEMLLFHGTAERAAEDVLAHQNGLDPRFSNGGFYGQGIYLAEDPSYPIGGRYAHRISGSGGSRVQLLIVKAALGSQQEMGQRISAETRAMRMPDVRVEGPPRLLYDSVRGGPHRPFVSGGGENGCDASIVHVVYESRQMYPAYVIEVEMEMGAEVMAAVRKNSAEGSASAGPAPKRQRHAAPSGGGGGGGSSHSATHVPASAPPSDAEVRAMGVAAVAAALRAHGSVSRVALAACERLVNLCGEVQNRQAAVDAGGIEAIVAALQAHPQVADVQQNGCRAMAFVCAGTDAAGIARKRAADVGGIEAIVAALQAHPQVAGVQGNGCCALGNVCVGTDATGIARFSGPLASFVGRNFDTRQDACWGQLRDEAVCSPLVNSRRWRH